MSCQLYSERIKNGSHSQKIHKHLLSSALFSGSAVEDFDVSFGLFQYIAIADTVSIIQSSRVPLTVKSKLSRSVHFRVL